MRESLPHRYAASAEARQSGDVELSACGLPPILAGPSAQFGGTGTQWSPETLLPAAIANCYVLTFRAVSAASWFGWQRLHCEVEAILERRDRKLRFTRIRTRAILTIAAGADAAKARRLLAKADRDCLVANSLSGERDFSAEIVSA